MIGIYKITSPTNRIYIGKSTNVKNRFDGYKKRLAKGQTLLQRSFLKYGVLNHTFEVLCYCNEEELHNLERYYQILFNSINNGLNCILAGEKYYECKKELEKRNNIISIIDSILF